MYRYFSYASEERHPFISFTFYRQATIVEELEKRSTETLMEQLKKDYCCQAYQNELNNLATILGKRVGMKSDFKPLDLSRKYTISEIASFINAVSDFKSILEREALIQYIDYAAWMMEHSVNTKQISRLVERIAQLDQTGMMPYIPWLKDKLAEAFAS